MFVLTVKNLPPPNAIPSVFSHSSWNILFKKKKKKKIYIYIYIYKNFPFFSHLFCYIESKSQDTLKDVATPSFEKHFNKQIWKSEILNIG